MTSARRPPPTPRPLRPSGGRARRDDERGASAVELVLYTPLLMMLTLASVQFGLIYLGDQVASGAAREGNRVARVSGAAAGEARARQMVGALGSGVLLAPRITIVQVGDEMQASVSGQALSLVPFVDPPTVREVVRGPIEQFRPDGG